MLDYGEKLVPSPPSPLLFRRPLDPSLVRSIPSAIHNNFGCLRSIHLTRGRPVLPGSPRARNKTWRATASIHPFPKTPLLLGFFLVV